MQTNESEPYREKKGPIRRAIQGATKSPGIRRDQAMKDFIGCLDRAMLATEKVETFNPRLANLALRHLARVATRVAYEEIKL